MAAVHRGDVIFYAVVSVDYILSSVVLWGRNITDEFYWTRNSKVNELLVHFAGMPQTYGITVSYMN